MNTPSKSTEKEGGRVITLLSNIKERLSRHPELGFSDLLGQIEEALANRQWPPAKRPIVGNAGYLSRGDARWMAYCPEAGVEFFQDKASAEAAAARLIRNWLDDDGWMEEAGQVFIAQITDQSAECDVVHRPPADQIDEDGLDGDGNWWDSDWDRICNFKLQPVAAEQSTKAQVPDAVIENLARQYGCHTSEGFKGFALAVIEKYREAMRAAAGKLPILKPIEKAALALYKPPFTFDHGYIVDSRSLVVSDDGTPGELQKMIAGRVRGWGRIQRLKDFPPEKLQDTVGELIAAALTEFWTSRQRGGAS